MNPIGLKDRNGRMIHVGDIVEFYFCADHDRFGQARNGCGCATRMVDEVVEIDDTFYFSSPGFGYAFADRFNQVCAVIGSLPDDCEMFWRENKDGLLTNEDKNAL